MLAHAAAEKAQLEAEAPAFTIPPGDAAGIARGKQALEPSPPPQPKPQP